MADRVNVTWEWGQWNRLPPIWLAGWTGVGELWPDIDDIRPCSFTIGSEINLQEDIFSNKLNVME